MSSSIFKKNIAVLKIRYPDLAKKVLKSVIPPELKLIRTNSRYMSLALDLYGRYAFFHSKDNPLKEAQEQLKNFNPPGSVNILVLGVGLGYHLLELSKRIKKDNYVIVVEQYLPIFKLALQCVDLTALLTNKKVFFFVDSPPEEIFEALKDYVFHISNNDLTVLHHDSSCLLFRDYYDSVEKRIKELIIWAQKNFDAGVRFRKLYQSNIIKNLFFYFTRPGISHLKDLQLPCIITAAGPSLKEAIDVLKDLDDRAIIISVDTAMFPLISYGIKPHFVVSIDPHRINYMHFSRLTEEDMQETALIIDPQVYYQIPLHYKGPIFVPTLRNSKIVEYFSDLVGEKGYIDKGMSVAHSAFSLARAMGCSPIIFAGLDLCFFDSGTHIKEAANYKKKIEDNRNLIKIKSVTGKDVLTDDVFYAYIKHFEIELSKTDCPCFNASFGALISGMRYIKPKEISKYIHPHPIEKQKLLEVEPFLVEKDKIEKKKLLLIKKAFEIKDKAQSIIELLKIKPEVNKAKQLYSHLRSYGLIIDIMEESMEQAAFLLSNRKIWEGKQEIEKFLFYYKHLIDSCDFIIKEVSNARFY